MSIGLTYLSQKPVVQYMEAAKRIALATRCSSIQKFERTLPLSIQALSLVDWTLTVNGQVYRIRRSRNSDSIASKEQHRLYAFLFRGRNLVLVENMSVYTDKLEPMCFPMSLRFRVKNLSFGEFSNPYIWLKIVDDLSFPFAKFTVPISQIIGYLYSELSQHVVIICDDQMPERVRRVLAEQTIGNVEIEGLEEFEGVLRDTLQFWISHGKDIGTKVAFSSENNGRRTSEILKGLEYDFRGKPVHFKDGIGRTHMKQPLTFPCRSNPASEVLIYRYQHQESWKICMEMIPVGTTNWSPQLTTSDWILILLFIFVMPMVLMGVYSVLMILFNY